VPTNCFLLNQIQLLHQEKAVEATKQKEDNCFISIEAIVWVLLLFPRAFACGVLFLFSPFIFV
jgi:hypothetical protein